EAAQAALAIFKAQHRLPHECKGGVPTPSFQVSSSQRFQIRQHEPKHSALLQIGERMLESQTEIVECQVLQHMAAIQTATRGFRNRQPAHDVPVTYIRRETSAVFGVEVANQRDSLEPQCRACIEVRPCLRCAKKTTIMNVVYWFARHEISLQ